LAIYKHDLPGVRSSAMEPDPGSTLETGIEREMSTSTSGKRRAAPLCPGAGANPEMAHDALQEAFFRFFLCVRRGSRSGPQGWLFRVSAIIYWIRRRRARERSRYGVAAQRGWARANGNRWRASELLQGLRQIGLSPREDGMRAATMEDLRYEEMRRAGLSAGTVGALLPGRTQDRKRWAAEGPRPCPGGSGRRTLCILGSPL